MYLRDKFPTTESPSVKDDPVAERLLKAAEYINRHGWWNGRDGAEHSVCAAVAIDHVTRGGMFSPALQRFQAHIGVSGIGGVFRWNDAQPDGATVIRALRSAAHSRN